MKTVILSTLVCLLSLSSFDVQAASKKVPGSFAECNSVITLPNGSFIYKNSAPLRNSRGQMIGLRYEPTLIMKSRVTASSTQVLDSTGKKIGSCPKTSAHGFAGGRMRCTMQTASLRRAAVKSGSPAVTFTIGGGRCVKVPDAGRCYGSVKGGCNRLIK